MRYMLMPRFLLFAGLCVCLTSGGMWLKNGLALNTDRVVFTSSRDGNSEIYVMDTDGGNQERLTYNPTEDGDSSWSPDGKRIAFVSNRNGGFIQVYVMDADGNNTMRLTDGVWDEDPDWSPDGQKIAFTSRPDGMAAHISVMDADGNNLSKLEDNASDPSWSPDGKEIVFVSWRDRSDEIYSIGADGNGLRKVTNDLAAKGAPAWSPDGKRIAYYSLHEGIFQIYVMGADGRNRKRLTHDREHNMFPAWSPDGGAIAYVSPVDARGIDKIHLMTADGHYLKQLSDVHNGWDSHPNFGPVGLSVSPASNKITVWGKLKSLVD